MSDTRHTPGPWKVNDDGQCFEIVQADPEPIICGGRKYQFGAVVIAEVSEQGDDSEGNASLLAAAPDLLEACKIAKKYLEPDLAVFWRLVAVIAKAEGR